LSKGSSIEQPQEQTDDDAQNERRGEWKIEFKIATLDDDIAWQAPEAKSLADHPQKAEADHDEPRNDEKLGHRVSLSSRS